MNITSYVTKNQRGGKIHAKRGTRPLSVIGSEVAVVIRVAGDDGRTYRVELWPEDLTRIAAEAEKVAKPQEAVTA